MLNRVVSLSSLLVAVFSVALFAMCAWWTLAGHISEGDGTFLFIGSLLAAIVFSYRAADPAWLEPLSIVKRGPLTSRGN